MQPSLPLKITRARATVCPRETPVLLLTFDWRRSNGDGCVAGSHTGAGKREALCAASRTFLQNLLEALELHVGATREFTLPFPFDELGVLLAKLHDAGGMDATSRSRFREDLRRQLKKPWAASPAWKQQTSAGLRG